MFPQLHPPAQSAAAQVSTTVTFHICAADCTVSCGCWLGFSKFSEKFNYRPVTMISLPHFFNLLHLACRAPELGYEPFNSPFSLHDPFRWYYLWGSLKLMSVTVCILMRHRMFSSPSSTRGIPLSLLFSLLARGKSNIPQPSKVDEVLENVETQATALRFSCKKWVVKTRSRNEQPEILEDSLQLARKCRDKLDFSNEWRGRYFTFADEESNMLGRKCYSCWFARTCLNERPCAKIFKNLSSWSLAFTF